MSQNGGMRLRAEDVFGTEGGSKMIWSGGGSGVESES